jgi:membrane-bound serine protease (ClpP class)
MNRLPGEGFLKSHRERLIAPPGRSLSFLLPAALVVAGCLIPGGAEASQNNLAAFVELTGLIDPASAESLLEQIEGAEKDGASALIVRLDTPGAVKTDVNRLVRAIVGSPIPVVMWVGPGDAGAEGAGTLLTMAAHYSAMTPAATLGPAEPVDLKNYRGGRPSTRASQSAEILLELIGRSRRGVQRTSKTDVLHRKVGAGNAERLGMVDATTGSISELLQGLKGRSITVNGRAVTLSDEPFTLRFMKMGLIERLLHGAARPEAAYLLLLVGAFGIIFELYNPGVGAAALAGGVALGFGIYALTVLPTSWLGAALIGAGFGLLVLDLRTNRLGVSSAVGFAAILTGSLLLFVGVHPSLRLSLWAVAAGLAATAIFFVSIMTSALAARAAKPLVGTDGLVGSIGVARTDISPEGQVMARGTLWRAHTVGAAIGRGTPIKVMGVRGLILMVEPAEEIAPGS